MNGAELVHFGSALPDPVHPPPPTALVSSGAPQDRKLPQRPPLKPGGGMDLLTVPQRHMAGNPRMGFSTTAARRLACGRMPPQEFFKANEPDLALPDAAPGGLPAIAVPEETEPQPPVPEAEGAAAEGAQEEARAQ